MPIRLPPNNPICGIVGPENPEGGAIPRVVVLGVNRIGMDQSILGQTPNVERVIFYERHLRAPPQCQV